MDKVSIQYHPGLIEELHEEHEVLLKHIEFIRDLVEKKEIKPLPLAMELLRGEMLQHVSKEILQLYIYLKYSLDKESDQYRQMKRLRKAMDDMLHKIIEFLDQSGEVDLNDLVKNPEVQESFMKNVQKAVNLLSQRISVEEKVLFPMYKPV